MTRMEWLLLSSVLSWTAGCPRSWRGQLYCAITSDPAGGVKANKVGASVRFFSIWSKANSIAL